MLNTVMPKWMPHDLCTPNLESKVVMGGRKACCQEDLPLGSEEVQQVGRRVITARLVLANHYERSKDFAVLKVQVQGLHALVINMPVGGKLNPISTQALGTLGKGFVPCYTFFLWERKDSFPFFWGRMMSWDLKESRL